MKEKHSRREFIKTVALSGALGAAGIEVAERLFSLWTVKAEHGKAVLDLHQMLTLASVAAQIIPTDETPGAREAGTVDYIDTKLHADASLRQMYQDGLKEIDKISQTQFGSGFAALNQTQQKQVLTSAEKSAFFQQVVRDTVEAFAHSHVGQTVLGYPGGAQPHGYHNLATPLTD